VPATTPKPKGNAADRVSPQETRISLADAGLREVGVWRTPVFERLATTWRPSTAGKDTWTVSEVLKPNRKEVCARTWLSLVGVEAVAQMVILVGDGRSLAPKLSYKDVDGPIAGVGQHTRSITLWWRGLPVNRDDGRRALLQAPIG
jgi:hypothetical protein